jgi:hypothetical protein
MFFMLSKNKYFHTNNAFSTLITLTLNIKLMTTTVKRAYKGKDVDMLTACSTIIEQANNHKSVLISKRANWVDPFFPDLKTRIENAFSNYLGIDNAQQMREATQVVTDIQANALRDLAEFKVQLMEDFKTKKNRRDEILTRLDFTSHHKEAQNKDQEALIQLLLSFKKNMTPALQTEITSAGTSTTLITAIILYADVLKNSDINQETMKGSRKVISQTAVKEFNEIYNQVISIAKISANFFKDDKAIKEKFSFAKTLKNLNRPPKSDQELIPGTPFTPAP